MLSADHPLPSEHSVAAGERLLEVAADAGERDIVIACFTGGSSSLASVPPPGVEAAEKRMLHELLLSSGIGIVEINTVRKHVSAIKGGRLAAAAAPARLVNLSVSDVAGDPLDAITDPSVRDSSSAADAVATLRRHGLWDRTPVSVRAHLASAAAESPALEGAGIQTVLLATGATACDAMALEATALRAGTRGDLDHASRARHASSAERWRTWRARAPSAAPPSRQALCCSAAVARAR